MNKILLVLLFINFNSFSHNEIRWVDIGEDTYNHGFIYPYKVKLSVPYGERNIEDIKEGLIAMKFSINWLPTKFSKTNVRTLFSSQLENFYSNEENHRLSKNLIGYFLKKLPSTKRHDTWEYIYLPDEGTRLFIDNEIIHHLVGADINRALLQSWLNKSPVLTSALFKRLLKLQ